MNKRLYYLDETPDEKFERWNKENEDWEKLVKKIERRKQKASIKNASRKK